MASAANARRGQPPLPCLAFRSALLPPLPYPRAPPCSPPQRGQPGWQVGCLHSLRPLPPLPIPVSPLYRALRWRPVRHTTLTSAMTTPLPFLSSILNLELQVAPLPPRIPCFSPTLPLSSFPLTTLCCAPRPRAPPQAPCPSPRPLSLSSTTLSSPFPPGPVAATCPPSRPAQVILFRLKHRLSPSPPGSLLPLGLRPPLLLLLLPALPPPFLSPLLLRLPPRPLSAPPKLSHLLLSQLAPPPLAPPPLAPPPPPPLAVARQNGALSSASAAPRTRSPSTYSAASILREQCARYFLPCCTADLSLQHDRSGEHVHICEWFCCVAVPLSWPP